jgi:TonB-dependent SusC/RagA subfamily outer membrane receptor
LFKFRATVCLLLQCFHYYNLLAKDGLISHSIDEKTLYKPKRLLNKMMSIMRNECTRKMTLFLMALCAYGIAMAQAVTGRVTDKNNNPLEGALVLEKHTKNAAITGKDGTFSVKAAQGSTLVISMVGYTTREMKVGAGTLNVVLLPGNHENLDEVVVVGYASQKKVNLTGAVTQISGEALQNRPMNRVTQGLQGMVAGLNVVTTSDGGAPNATQSLNVRGYTGLGATGSPLIVIDGVQGGDINAINAADIKSISVLKDAASTAIYGSSAPYGVILITTEQGSKGKHPRITYNNNFS